MEEKKNNSRIRLGITQGDINGISYEVILKTFSDSRMFDICTPILYGSTKVASYHKKLLQLHQDIAFNAIHNAQEAGDKRFNVINLTNDEIKIDVGKLTEVAGAQSRLSLNRACEDLKKGDIDVLVTAPISKKNIQSPEFDFPGHTEYLSHQFGCSSLMIMVCDRIRIGIVTNHLALKDVPNAITHNLLYDKIMLMNESLKRDFGVPMPKIAVLALDPHAGDNGVIGSLDMTVVKPVIEQVQNKGVLAYGPYPSDGFFGNGDFTKSVWEFDKPVQSKLHPTMKPVALVENALKNSSQKGEVIMDLFGGSGTTMIAAESLGRKARLMELDPHYCDVIRKRWAEFVHGEGCDWQALTPCAANAPRS